MHASARISLGLSLGLLTGAATLMACGGDDSSSPATNTGTTTGTANGQTATLQVLPSPAYSGFDGTHKYQIPIKVNNKTGAKWTASKPELVDIQETAEGVMVTTKGAGEVILTATLGTETGATKLSITQFAAADWDNGDKRYNSGVSVFPGDGGVPTNPTSMIMLNKDGACTTCHGDTAVTLKVQHTPYQTGGYSDEEMATIILKGMKPAGAVQRSFIPSFFWGMFHAWNVTDAQKVGLISYLRALPPKSQGAFDYPIRPGADGGLVDMNGNPVRLGGGGDAGGSTTTTTGGSDAGSSTPTTSDAGVAAEADAGAHDAG